MAHNTLIGGTIGKITEGKDLIGGTAYSRKYGKPLVGGTTYKIGLGGGGGTVGNLAVGSSVYMNRNGEPMEFIVIHQGLPDANLYDASCDGTWLLQKYILSTPMYQAGNTNYGTSTTHITYLNTNEIAVFDENIQAAIKEVKIPYVNGTDMTSPIASKENGVTSKLFLLSGREVGFTANMYTGLPEDGACLDYFKGTLNLDTKRIGRFPTNAATNWFLRTTISSSYMMAVGADGGTSTIMFIMNGGMRPALILPKELAYDENFNVIA